MVTATLTTEAPLVDKRPFTVMASLSLVENPRTVAPLPVNNELPLRAIFITDSFLGLTEVAPFVTDNLGTKVNALTTEFSVVVEEIVDFEQHFLDLVPETEIAFEQHFLFVAP